MPRVHLTDLTIKALKPNSVQVDYYCKSLRGFGVRVSPAGAKTFFLLSGSPKRRRHSLGRYGPNPGELSLSDARKAALTLKGAPPSRFASTPLSEALKTYYKGTIIPNYRPRSAKEAQRLLDKHTATLPKYLGDITTRDCMRVIDGLVATPGEANHFFGTLKTFFNWCEQRQLIQRSPLANTPKPLKETSRDRTLSQDELRAVWNATEALTQFNTIVRLCILTGQRRSELARIEPRWLNNDVLTVPASVAKNNNEHNLPLSPYAVHLIQITPLGSYNAWSQPKVRLDRRCGVADWTLHDLRRTFATMHAQIGTPPHITERMLNHITGTLTPIARIYNRHTFLNEMRTAAANHEAHLRTFLNFPDVI